MEITSNLQSLIILFVIIALLIIVAAIIFYKLGKKQRVVDEIHNGKNEIHSEQNTPRETKTASKNNELPIIDQTKMMLYKKEKESNISPTELYENKIEREINKTEKNIVKENKTLDLKFLKYTSEGYKPAKGDNEHGALGWR